MRVLHAIPSVGPQRGGPSLAVLDMCRWQAAAGLDVTLVTTDDNGSGRLTVPLDRPVQQDGYSIVYFPRSLRPYTISWPLAAWLVRHASEFDIFHIHAAFSYVSTVAAQVARWRRIPYVLTPHGILGGWGMQHRRARIKPLSIAVIERPALNHAALIHATSAAEARELEALGAHSPIQIIPLGLETPDLPEKPRAILEERWPALRGRIAVLFLGRLHSIKGLETLLPALALAEQTVPNLSLLLAGEGDPDYAARLNTLLGELGLKDRVVDTGYLRGPDKWAALAGSDLVVMPSYSESFGLVAAETMAAGTPIILTDGVAIHTVVSEAGAGRVVPVGDVDALAAALIELARDPDLRRQMGAAGRAAAARFAPQTVTAALVDRYRGIVNGKLERAAP